MSGALRLGQAAALTDVLEIACRRCGRHGRYGTAGLVARHGAGIGVPNLRRILAADCSRWGAADIYDLCGVHFPQLPELFGLG